jgi:hypothetical protein
VVVVHDLYAGAHLDELGGLNLGVAVDAGGAMDHAASDHERKAERDKGGDHSLDVLHSGFSFG